MVTCFGKRVFQTNSQHQFLESDNVCMHVCMYVCLSGAWRLQNCWIWLKFCTFVPWANTWGVFFIFGDRGRVFTTMSLCLVFKLYNWAFKSFESYWSWAQCGTHVRQLDSILTKSLYFYFILFFSSPRVVLL